MDAKGTGASAIVEFDYTANELDELSIAKGDLITNIKIQSGGWWYGVVSSTGKSGMFPDNFVKLLDPNNDDKVIIRDKASTKNRRCKVIYSYKENKEDELTLAVGDILEIFDEVEEGWMRGKLGNKVGVFPSNFVEVIESTSPINANHKTSLNNTIIQNKINNNRSSLTNSREDLGHNQSGGNNDSTTDSVPILPPKPIREQCRVLYAYAPVNEDELKLNEGDIITIVTKDLPDKASPVKERPPIGTKTILNATSTSIKSSTQSYRKDSFGSKDSLTESNNLVSAERNSGIFGNVAAHRRSLETKSIETNHHGIEKPPRKSLIITDANKTPSDIRKSLENLDDKKSTPPPVLTKKPTVPIKKSPSVSTVAGSIFSGLKQKVKSVESKLQHHATHDGTDGIGSSKITSQVADNSDKAVIGEKINELDTVERGSYLQDVRQNRAKAPKRRPPTSAGSTSLIGDSNNNNVSMNGSHTESNDSSLTSETIISTSPAQTAQQHEEETVKPKAREWEKHKAPWMEELKANQARKTSPNIEHKSPDSDEKNDLSKSFSSSFSQKKSTQETFEVRASSMEVKSNSFDVFKKDNVVNNKEVHATSSINTSVDTSSAKSTTKISITDNSSSVMTTSSTTAVKVDDLTSNIRPTSVSLRNRSISPIPRTQPPNHHITKPSPTNISATHITTNNSSSSLLTSTATVTSSSTVDVNSKVSELEQRVNKLESLVLSQNATIDELKKLLRDESDKVKTLKNDLEKYAQCFTQDKKAASKIFVNNHFKH
ncbi:CD2-associated protein-like isoform X2 [Chironomus tepperi]|uniref:CD2-associated protein-like isoform X2 n=1 Tax=Chironomus tepperi TaxID=113505 RepID=UPI00391FA33A